MNSASDLGLYGSDLGLWLWGSDFGLFSVNSVNDLGLYGSEIGLCSSDLGLYSYDVSQRFCSTYCVKYLTLHGL